MPKLTVQEIRSAKPGRHADGGGLYLLVKPTGAKTWVLRIVLNGRRRDFGLGSVTLDPPSKEAEAIPLGRRRVLSLREARDKAAEGRRLAKSGVDPALEWRKLEAKTPTFEEAAREYHELVKSGWKNGKHGDQWINTLEAHAFPLIGKRLVNDIDANAVQSVLLPIWLTIPETARRVRQRVAAVLDYSKGQGWREQEAPMRAVNKLMGAIKQPAKKNFAAMPYSALPAFMAKLRGQEKTIGRLALQFLILTAARSGEVRGATWQEIDWDAAEWRLPATRMKAKKPHIVPLVPAAMDILQEMKGLSGGKPAALIFPGLKNKPLSDVTLSKVLRVAGGGAYTVHGFRSAFRDWAADTGFADAWAEAALAHGNPDKTEAAYRRTTFFTQRREKLMPAWERYALGDASNVIALAERRA